MTEDLQAILRFLQWAEKEKGVLMCWGLDADCLGDDEIIALLLEYAKR